MTAQDVHIRSLETSTALTRYALPNAIAPLTAVGVLEAAGVRSVLVGTHGIGGWMRKPRASSDVDLLIASRSHTKAIRALTTAFPTLEVDEHKETTRLVNPGERQFALDIMRPIQPLFQSALRHVYRVTDGERSYRISSLEMAVAMKFAAMTIPMPPYVDQYLYAHDFIVMVKANPVIDLAKLRTLGDLVRPDGGEEVVRRVADLRAGVRFRL